MVSGRPVRRKISFDLKLDEEEVIETGGIVFKDGRCIELIRGADQNLSLLDSSSKTFEEEIEVDERTYVPPNLSPSILEALCLTMGRSPYGSTENLLKAIHDIFVDFGIESANADLLTYYSISTWFAEVLPMAPCLVITGPGPEANLVLQLLWYLVRHGLSLANLNFAEFRSLPMHVQPTLLIGHVDRAMYEILSASAYPRAHFPYKGDLIDLHCAKIVYVGRQIPNNFKPDAMFRITLMPSYGKLPFIGADTGKAISQRIQPLLLDYRLTHITKVRSSAFDVPSFPSGLRMMARTLGASIIDSPQSRNGVMRLLEEQSNMLKTDREYLTIGALLDRCHSTEDSIRTGVGEIAKTVTTMLKEHGQTQGISAEEMGDILRDFGIRTKRDSRGKKFYLTNEVRSEIHSLARSHEIKPAAPIFMVCRACSEFIDDEEGAKLDYECSLSDEEVAALNGPIEKASDQNSLEKQPPGMTGD